jgi:hypothetical protein
MSAKKTSAPSAPRNPWSKFFWTDWLADPCLRLCSLAAKGLWIDMLALMHQSGKAGYLVVSGQPVTRGQLAKILGQSIEEIEALLAELEANKVFSRDGAGTIYSRRVVRDEQKAALARKNGQRGGNPSLCNVLPFRSSDNPPTRERVKLEAEAEAEAEKNSAAFGAGTTASPVDLKAGLFKTGKAFLTEREGLTKQRAGGLINKWIRASNEITVACLLANAETHCHGSVIQYMEAGLRRHAGKSKEAPPRVTGGPDEWDRKSAEGRL